MNSIGIGNLLHVSQLSFALGTFFRQDMIPEGLSVLISAFSGFLEPFGCTRTFFEFWHFHTPQFYLFKIKRA